MLLAKSVSLWSNIRPAALASGHDESIKIFAYCSFHFGADVGRFGGVRAVDQQ
jgi:hypothetical protein